MMTYFRFSTACLLGLGTLASLTMFVCARRAPLAVSRLPHVDQASPLGVRRGFVAD